MEGLIRYQAFTNKQIGSRRWIALIVCVYAAIFVVGLSTYLQWQSVNLVLGIVSLWFCTTLNRQSTGSKRFGYVAVVLLCLLVLMPVKTMLYLAVLSGIFFLLESYYGHINYLPLLSVLMMSPFFQYVSNIFVFPIRLQLSKWAGWIFNGLGSEVVVTGNVLTIHQQEFSVDPACMGLNMLVVSMLLSIMLVGIYQKKFKLQLHFIAVVGILLFTLGLNIISNMIRILLLMQFAIMREDIMHEITGIACLVLYVCIPLALVIRWMIKRFGRLPGNIEKKRRALLWPHIVLAAFHLLLTIKVLTANPAQPIIDTSSFTEKGYAAQLLDDDVVKLDNTHSLVYIKPIRNFYNADYNPMICWKGSGYELKKINTNTIGGIEVYTATLEKEKDVLFTSWWYDNGQQRTISQMDWRWNMLTGSSAYAIINVTSDSSNKLESEVEKIFSAGFARINKD